MRMIIFNELRKIKDSLPNGSIHKTAGEPGLNVDTVRNFFGSHNSKEGKSVGIHLEPGPDGGLVMIDGTIVLDRVLKILGEIAGEVVEPVRAQERLRRIPITEKQLGFLVCLYKQSSWITYGG